MDSDLPALLELAPGQAAPASHGRGAAGGAQVTRRPRKPPVPPGYIERVLAMYASANPPVGNHVIEICHDDWCDLLNGRGSCNCEPEVDEPERIQ